MNSSLLKKALPHIIAVVVFLIVSVAYNKTALDGKVVSQSDVQQFKGMAKQSDDFKEKNGHWPLWTESMFSGMPAYNIAIEGTTRDSILPDLNWLFFLGKDIPGNPSVFFSVPAFVFIFLPRFLD